MDNSLINLINSSKKALVLLPVNPTFDDVAAGLALYLSLSKNKETTISSHSPMTVEFNRLVGVNKITLSLGSKNLVISFINFQATDIERVSYDIENGQFKLSVIPKPGFKAPTSEQVKIDYAGESPDTLFIVGGGSEADFPMIKSSDLVDVKIAHLGNKLLEVSADTQILSFATSASSNSELIAQIIKNYDLVINADIATNLLAGIEEGSDNFQKDTVTAETFEIFSQLLKMGGLRYKKIENNFPQGAVPDMPYNQPQQPVSQNQIPDNQESIDKNQQYVEQMAQGQEAVEIDPNKVPKSWTEPKVYTGTTVN